MDEKNGYFGGSTFLFVQDFFAKSPNLNQSHNRPHDHRLQIEKSNSQFLSGQDAMDFLLRAVATLSSRKLE